MIRLPIEHFVAGAPQNERGDGTLSATTGASSKADQLSKWLDMGLPDDHAVFFMLVHPDTNLNTFVHAQGSFTVFPEFNRYYNTRAIYELSREDHATPGLDNRFSPLINALDKMHQYKERFFDSPNLVTINERLGLQPLTAVEEQFKNILVHAIVNNQQVFIRLADSDKRKGDELRHSPKLLSLLRAIDELPQGVRGYVSMGFSMEANLKISQVVTDHLLVIAHQDDFSEWGASARDGIVIDWRENEPKVPSIAIATPAEHKRLEQVAPLINTFLGNGRATRNAVMNMMHKIPENVDRILKDTNSPNENDIKILMALYDSEALGVYRQSEAVSKLMKWKQTDVGIPIKISDVLKRFPDQEQNVTKMLSAMVEKCSQYEQYRYLYNEYGDIANLLGLIKEKILASINLMDKAAQYGKEPLSELLCVDIRHQAKQFTLTQMLERLGISYYDITIKDLKINGFKDLAQVLRYLKANHQEEQVKQLKIDTRNWKVDDIDANIYQEVVKVLSENDRAALNEKLFQRYDKLQPDLARQIVANLTIDDKYLLEQASDAPFIKMMEILLNERESFIHNAEAAEMRLRYVELKIKESSLERINSKAWGPKYTNLPDFVAKTLPKIDYSRSNNSSRLVNDINFLMNHLDSLPEEMRLHLEKAVKQQCKKKSNTLLDVAKIVKEIDSRFSLDIDLKDIRSLGDKKALEQEIKALEENGQHKLAGAIKSKLEELSKRHAAASFDDVIKALKHPMQLQVFEAHDSNSLREVLEAKPMSLDDYFILINTVYDDYTQKCIEKGGLEKLFDKAISDIENNNAKNWLLDEQNEKRIIQILQEGKKGKSSKKNKNNDALYVLIDSLRAEEKEEFKNKFPDQYKESALQSLLKRFLPPEKRLRNISAAVILMFLLGGVLLLPSSGLVISLGPIHNCKIVQSMSQSRLGLI